MPQRKCMFCKGPAIHLDESSEILQYVAGDGSFLVCTYAEAWELCREVGDPENLPPGATFLVKNDEYVGRFRSLD